MLCEKASKYPDPPEEVMKQIKDIGNIISKIIISSKKK